MLVRSTTVAVDEQGRLLGFATVGDGRDEQEPGLPGQELMALYVRGEVYGAGVGAIRFYERQGFAFDGRAKTEPVGVERRMVRRVTAR